MPNHVQRAIDGCGCAGVGILVTHEWPRTYTPTIGWIWIGISLTLAVGLIAYRMGQSESCG